MYLIFRLQVLTMLPILNYSNLSSFIPKLFSFLFLLMLFQKAYGENALPLDLQHESLPQDLVTASIDELLSEGILMTQTLSNPPMPKLKNSKLGKIFTRHYNKCLGGADHWNNIKSVKISADLYSSNGCSKYESVAKYPNFYRISLSLNGQTHIFAFDGTNIREKQISKEGTETFVETENLKRTINVTQLPQYLHYTQQSGKVNQYLVNVTQLPQYLLYPLQAGKAYQYLGTVREYNTVCYKLRLFTEQNFVLDYFLDVESYRIVTIKIADRLEEFSPITVRYYDYRLIDGIYFAYKIESFISDQRDSLLKVNSVATNIGASRWMFDL